MIGGIVLGGAPLAGSTAPTVISKAPSLAPGARASAGAAPGVRAGVGVSPGTRSGPTIEGGA